MFSSCMRMYSPFVLRASEVISMGVENFVLRECIFFCTRWWDEHAQSRRLLKEKIVSRLISLQLGARVHIGRVDVRFLEGLSSIEFSLQNTRLVDSRNLEALYIPKASVNMIRRKGKYHIDVSVENPQTTVYFENYALTRTNWRRLLV